MMLTQGLKCVPSVLSMERIGVNVQLADQSILKNNKAFKSAYKNNLNVFQDLKMRQNQIVQNRVIQNCKEKERFKENYKLDTISHQRYQTNTMKVKKSYKLMPLMKYGMNQNQQQTNSTQSNLPKQKLKLKLKLKLNMNRFGVKNMNKFPNFTNFVINTNRQSLKFKNKLPYLHYKQVMLFLESIRMHQFHFYIFKMGLLRNIQQLSIIWEQCKTDQIRTENQYKKIEQLQKNQPINREDKQQELLIELDSQDIIKFTPNKQNAQTDRTCLSTSTIASSACASNSACSSIQKSEIKQNPNKSILVLSKLSDLNKIDTKIRQISAVSLKLTNSDAKKIIELVNKSFVRVLDLSDNNLNNLFVKDLTKGNLGKYLKILKLQRNQINMKDRITYHKIESFKSCGVNILL